MPSLLELGENRQKSGAGYSISTLISVIVMTAIALACSNDSRAGADANWTGFEPLERIQAAAIEYIRIQVQDSHARVEIEPERLDPRLALPACELELTAAAAPGAALFGRTAVAVECPGRHPWRLYVRLRVRAYENVVIAKRSLSRGNEITEADLQIEERDLSQLHYVFTRDKDQVTGRAPRRNIRAGEAIPVDALSARALVRTGQEVTLQAGEGQLRISAPGIALADGAKGDRIRIRNRSSERVVVGTVVAPGLVEAAQ